MFKTILSLALALLACPSLAEMRVVALSGDVRALQPSGSETVKQGSVWSSEAAFKLERGAELHLQDPSGNAFMIPGNSEVRFSGDRIALISGGVQGNLVKAVPIQAGEVRLRASGLLRLKLCGQDCGEEKGLYGHVSGGEVVVEYRGGRSVVRNRPFFVDAQGGRPRLLAQVPELLDENNRKARAVEAKVVLAETIRTGIDAFQKGDYVKARETLGGAREQSPMTPVLSYYLGLATLELQDTEAALANLQQFVRDDPGAATEKGAQQLVTMLLTNQLQEEVKNAVQREKEISALPPEPGTIAIHPFVNRKDPAYSALSKGIAAMVISDLSKVPGLKVLERQKVQKLVEELKLSESNLVDEAEALRSGRMMRAERVVVGSFGVEK
jgi:hypothetical protein